MIIFIKKSRGLRCETLMVAKYEQSKRAPIPGIGHYHSAIVNADEKLHYTTRQIQLRVGYPRVDSVLKAEEYGQLSMIEKTVSLRNGLIVGAIRRCRLSPRTDSHMSVLT
jgi:hypothetical protein